MRASTMNAEKGRARQVGFSLIELLIVVAIIVAVCAIALPSVIRFLRLYAINGASEEVANEIRAARTTAIMKNAGWGVVFVVTSNTTYRYAIEDGQLTPGTRVPVATSLTTTNTALAKAQLGPERHLSGAMVFSNSCTGFAANDYGVRFTNLGMACDPSGTSTAKGACPGLTGIGGTMYVMIAGAGGANAGEARVCLQDPRRGLMRQVVLSPGGRVTLASLETPAPGAHKW